MNPIFIIPILVYVSLGVLFATVKLLKIFHGKKRRRSPFTSNFLRSPGQSLMAKLDELNEDLSVYFTFVFVMPILFYAFYITDFYLNSRIFSVVTAIMYVIAACIFLGFFIYKIVNLLNLRRKTRFGYDGEVATGQELNQLMLQGYHVFHDFVADKFNIDHIVVGTAGVFAVETKARSKPTSDNSKDDYKVTYDGRCLHFPGWREVKPMEQAKIQAAWLERWLSSCTGEKTFVRPVVTLPGWFVTRTSSEGIAVINPRQFASIAKPVGGRVLDSTQIKRIVHQLDQHCRNIEPKDINGLGGCN